MEGIDSESRFAWKLVKSILLLPFVLILVLLRKKSLKDLTAPVKELVKFIFQAKVTITLIIINTLVFFILNIMLFLNIINIDFIQSYFISTKEYFLTLKLIPIIGSWFFHASLLHLFGNMFFLFILGRVVEKNLGKLKTLKIYFGAAIISTVIDNLVHIYIIPIENYAAVGASGAIAGIAAAALLIDPFYITWLLGIPLPIAIVVLMQLYTDITGIFAPASNIGHIAHIGGYLSIFITMKFLDKEDQTKMKKNLGLCIAAITIASIAYFFLARSIFSVA
jgi:membrane associated rhomboid family serine protease